MRRAHCFQAAPADMRTSGEGHLHEDSPVVEGAPASSTQVNDMQKAVEERVAKEVARLQADIGLAQQRHEEALLARIKELEARVGGRSAA